MGYILPVPLWALGLITGSEWCPYHATSKNGLGLHCFHLKAPQITGGQRDTLQIGIFTAWNWGAVLHTLGRSREERGSAEQRQPKPGDNARGCCPPEEVARPGLGRSILPFGCTNGGWPELTLLGSCFGEDWFPGSELGSWYSREYKLLPASTGASAVPSYKGPTWSTWKFSHICKMNDTKKNLAAVASFGSGSTVRDSCTFFSAKTIENILSHQTHSLKE